MQPQLQPNRPARAVEWTTVQSRNCVLFWVGLLATASTTTNTYVMHCGHHFAELSSSSLRRSICHCCPQLDEALGFQATLNTYWSTSYRTQCTHWNMSTHSQAICTSVCFNNVGVEECQCQFQSQCQCQYQCQKPMPMPYRYCAIIVANTATSLLCVSCFAEPERHHHANNIQQKYIL